MAIIDIGNERYKVNVYYRDQLGQSHRKCETVQGKRKAQRLETKLKQQGVDGQLTHGAHVTFGAYFESWLKSREDAILRGDITPQTLTDNRKKGRALCRHFGKARLTSITPPVVRDYLSTMAKADKSGTTLRHHFTLLRQVLKQATLDGLLRANPCDRVKPPATDTEEKRALDPAQVRELLTALETLDSRMYLPALVAVTTGTRRGELLALTWDDIDFERGAANIRASIEESTGRIKTTKTPRGQRLVPLVPATATALKNLKRDQAELRMEWRQLWEDQNLVFPSLDTRGGRKAGRVWQPTAFNRQWRAALGEASERLAGEFVAAGGGIEEFAPLDWTPHEMRHTYLTHLDIRGVRDEVRSRAAGHSNSNVLRGVYTHVHPEEQQQIVDALADLL